MRSYAAFSPTFWTKGSGKRLRGNRDAQLVGAYLITCPSSSMVGIYYLPITTLCHELGMTISEANAALAFCTEQGFAFYDAQNEIVWVPNLARIDIGETLKPGDRRRSKIVAELKPFIDHRFYRAFIDLYGAAYMLGLLPLNDGASMGDRMGHAGVVSESVRGIPVSHPGGGTDRVGMGSDPGEGEPERENPPAELSQTAKLAAREARWRAAVGEGISVATGAPCSFRDEPWQQAALAAAITAHAPKDARGEKLDDWLRERGKAYGTRAKSTQATITLRSFEAWLNSGAPGPLQRVGSFGRPDPAPAPYHSPGKAPTLDGEAYRPGADEAAGFLDSLGKVGGGAK